MEYNRVEHDERTREAQHAEWQEREDAYLDEIEAVPQELADTEPSELADWLINHKDQSGQEAFDNLLAAVAKFGAVLHTGAENDRLGDIKHCARLLAEEMIRMKEAEVKE